MGGGRGEGEVKDRSYLNSESEAFRHFKLVVAVVVEVEDSIQLGVGRHVDVVCIRHSISDRLSSVLLHLNVVKLPEARNNNGQAA